MVKSSRAVPWCCARCWSRISPAGTSRQHSLSEPVPASSCALQGGCLGTGDSPARVPCATWVPQQEQSALFIYPRAQAVSQQPPPPSSRHQELAHPCVPLPALTLPCRRLPCFALAHPHLPVQPSQGGWMALGQCQEPGTPPGPSVHQGVTSSEGCAPSWLQQLSPGSPGSLGVLDGCGSQPRALCRS